MLIPGVLVWLGSGLGWSMEAREGYLSLIELGNSDTGAEVLLIPLWIPALGAAMVAVGAWIVDWWLRERKHDGHCRTCGYNLPGIDGPRPECGKRQ